MTKLKFNFRQFLSNARSRGLLRMFMFSVMAAGVINTPQVHAHAGCAVKAQLHAQYDAAGVVDAAKESSADKAKKVIRQALRIGYNLGKVGGIFGHGALLSVSPGGIVPVIACALPILFLAESIYDDTVSSQDKVNYKSSGFKKVVKVLGNIGGMVIPVSFFVIGTQKKDYKMAAIFAMSPIALGENIYKIVKQHRAEKSASEVVAEAA